MVLTENGDNRLKKKSVTPSNQRLSTTGLDNKLKELGFIAEDSGSVNAVELNIGVPDNKYYHNMVVMFTPANANTGATTLKIKELSVTPLKYNGADLESGFLKTTSKYIAIYDVANNRFDVDLLANKKYVDDKSALKVDKSKDASGDVNLILTGGIYAYSTSLTNLPAGAGAAGSLLVSQGIKTTARSQILIDTNDRMWIRYGDSGGWNSWNEVTTIDSFTQLLTTEGYTKLPNGLILQWGVTVNSTSGTETFPIAFPKACFGVQITNSSTNNSGFISSFSITSFTWSNLNTVTNRYLAIGY